MEIFKLQKKVHKKLFGFEDNCVLTCCSNYSLLSREYMWAAVNVLKDGPNIWDPARRHDTELNLFDINGKFS